jgi:hypothetical protein
MFEGVVVQKRRAQHSKDRNHHVPLFVFTGFNEDNLAKHEKLLPMLMVWAAEVSQKNLAQVLFVTNYTMLNDNVSRYLPHKVDSLELHDVSYDAAVEVPLVCAVLCSRARYSASLPCNVVRFQSHQWTRQRREWVA